MRLLVQKNTTFTKNFVKWLIKILQMELMSNVNIKKVNSLNLYINEVLSQRKDIKLDSVNLNTALVVGVKHLTFYETDGYFCIHINPKTFYPGTKFRVYKFCEFINYGNLDIPGCNVFTNVFSNVADNLQTYYNIYSLERGA